MHRKFIVNPSAGKKSVGRKLDAIRRDIEKRLGAFDFVCTKSREHTTQETRAALRAGADQIIAVGGDGTLNAVVNGFFDKGAAVRPDAELVVTSWGTGCDYYRSVGGKSKWESLLTDARVEPVDVGEIEFLGAVAPSAELQAVAPSAELQAVAPSAELQAVAPSAELQNEKKETFFFMNVASVGMSAEVVLRQRELPAFLPALASYAVPSLLALLTFRPTPMRLVIDGKVYEGNFLNAFFAKGSTCGGGMKLGGRVSLSDGLFDVTLIHGMGLLKSLPRFAKLFTGNFEGDPMFTKTKARVIEVHAPTPLRVEADGEVPGTTGIRVRLREKAIRVCFPRDAAQAGGARPGAIASGRA